MLYDKHSIHTFTGNDIVLPLVILEELDKFKDRSGLTGDICRAPAGALQISVCTFNNAYVKHEYVDGWRVDESTDIRYKFELAPDAFQMLPDGLDIGYNDNHIIACAMSLKDKYKDTTVLVITKDINLRVKCDAVGVEAEDYFKDHVEEDIDKIKGYTTWECSSSDIDSFYSNGGLEVEEDFKPNSFVIGKSNKNSFLGIHKKGEIKKLCRKIDGLFQVEPRNSEQAFALEALLDPEIPLVTLTGLAGSGKTFLALMAGLHGLRGKHSQISKQIADAFPDTLFGYDRLVITRTLQPVGRDLGYLQSSGRSSADILPVLWMTKCNHGLCQSWIMSGMRSRTFHTLR